MTDLADLLVRRIRAEGPMTLAEYMTLCLTHPEHGYYTTRDPFGAEGDFVTAPEISQMFGELIGLALASQWDATGRGRASLVELGPGRGTLMADILRATSRVDGFAEAARPWLVEASPTLRRIQAQTLADHAPHWADRLDDLPEEPLFLVANEFLDALPVRQFLRTETGFVERMIGLDDRGNLSFGQGPAAPLAALDHRLSDTVSGDLVQISPAQSSVIETIASHIARFGGFALLIDYGDRELMQDTFQAVRRHKPTHPLAEPGLADLTAHVDFGEITRTLPGDCAANLTTQGAFLERLGITQRARSLAKGLSGDALSIHVAAHRRLTHPDEMGTLFKVLALTRSGDPVPPGFS